MRKTRDVIFGKKWKIANFLLIYKNASFLLKILEHY